MSGRAVRFGALGLALVAVLAIGASPAAAKSKTKTFSQCVSTFVPIIDGTATTTTASSAIIPVSVPKNRGKPQDGAVTAFNSAGVGITHTFDADLVILLVSPGGKAIILSRNNGADGNGYGTGGCPGGLVLYSDAFLTPATAPGNVGQAPIVGAFRPEQPLSTFVGGPARGNWSLVVYDVAGPDSGAINSVSLNFTYRYNAAKKKKKKGKK